MQIDFSEVILSIEERERERLLALKEDDVSSRPSPDKWSKKEMLGHLIDSASNNHQKFLRAQFAERLIFPNYGQREWVETQDYASESWRLLVELWSAYNLHLAHVIDRIPPEKLTVPCKIGDDDPVTLEGMIASYVRHMEHHLKQINNY